MSVSVWTFICLSVGVFIYIHMYVYNDTFVNCNIYYNEKFFLVLIQNDEIVFLKERKRKINFENINYTWGIFVVYNELK